MKSYKSIFLYSFLFIMSAAKANVYISESTENDSTEARLCVRKTLAAYKTTLTGKAAFEVAKCYARLNYDSAFIFLNITFQLGYSPGWAHEFLDFTTLKNDNRWKDVERKRDSIYFHNNPQINREVALKLRNLFLEDKRVRNSYNAIQEKYGNKSLQMDSIVRVLNKMDSIHILILTEIINKYGWPTKINAGSTAVIATWLIIQHSPIKYQKMYYDSLEKSAKSGDIEMADLAYTKDRILVFEGKKQIYGTQIKPIKEDGTYDYYPIEDEENVDKRRREVGLGSLSDYYKRWRINWQAPSRKEK